MNTLGTRLAVGIALVFGVVLLLAGISVYGSVRQQTERDAVSQAQALIAALDARVSGQSSGDQTEIGDRDLWAVIPPDIWVAIHDRTGTLINANQRQAAALAPAPGLQRVGDTNLWVVTETLPQQPSYTATVGIPYDRPLEYLEVLRTRLVTIGWLSEALLVVMVFVLVRRRLKPLGELAVAARQLGQGDWGRRFQAPGPADEITALAASFNTMADQLEAAFARQRAFVADASHELRTPVAILDGYVRMLQRWGKEDRTTLEEALSAMATETTHMKRLVARLLQAAAGGAADAVVREPFRLDHVVAQTTASAQLLGREHQVRIQTTAAEDVTVIGDPIGFREALLIVLDNAIKYSPEGGQVAVACRRVAERGVVTVTDQGPGIAEAAMPHIFERFYRGNGSRTAHRTGTGLGLAIARELMQAQGGRIAVEKTSSQGTVMVMELPSV